MANLLWYEEGLYVDLPYGYVSNVTELYHESDQTQTHHAQKVRFPPRVYYPMSRENDDFLFGASGQAVLSQINEQMDLEPSKRSKKRPPKKHSTKVRRYYSFF